MLALQQYQTPADSAPCTCRQSDLVVKRAREQSGHVSRLLKLDSEHVYCVVLLSAAVAVDYCIVLI